MLSLKFCAGYGDKPESLQALLNSRISKVHSVLASIDSFNKNIPNMPPATRDSHRTASISDSRDVPNHRASA